MLLRQLTSCRMTVQSSVAILSTANREQISEYLRDACAEVVKLLRTIASADTEFPPVIWASFDRLVPESAAQNFSLSGVELRIDSARSDYEIGRHYVSIGISLLNPRAHNALALGREEYRKWLLEEFLLKLDAASAVEGDAIRSVVRDRMRAWISGAPSRRYIYRGNGNFEVIGESLPESEQAYVNPAFLLGPPFDMPPYAPEAGK